MLFGYCCNTNMELLAVVTPPPYNYICWSTWKTFWGENFTPVKITVCGRRNVRKHGEIKNGEKYIILDIFSKVDGKDKRGVISSISRYRMEIPGKGMTTSLSLGTKNTNKKQKARFSSNDITNQDFRNFLTKFKIHLI